MKTNLNQELSVLCRAFHRGDITLTVYREQRRKILEQLGAESEQHTATTSPVLKRVITGTLVIVSLLAGTVVLVKYFL